MSIEAESRKPLPEAPLPLVVLAGFGEQQAEELRALLETECRIAAARSPRDARLALPAGKAAVVCIGSLLSTIETRHLIAEAGDPGQGGPLLVLTGAGPDPAMFQDLIDADRLFYLSPGEPPPADLAPLVRAALAHWGAARAEGPVPAGLADALRTARRVAAQPDAASAGDLLQLAAEESVHADRAYCLLHDPGAETLWSRAAGMAREERRESSAVGLVSFVARTGCRLRIENASNDPRFERQADDPLGARCGHYLAVPVRVPEPQDVKCGWGLTPSTLNVLAVLCAVRDPGHAPFSEDDEAALELLAATVAPSLAQLTLAGQLESGEPMPVIFREEALEHHAAPGVREGDWLRLSPTWAPAMLWLLIGLVVVFLGFAAVSSIGEYSTGPAVVRLAGRTEVTASQAGQVTAVEARPGERVDAGRILVRFQNAREAAELARIEREWELQLVERLRDLSAGSAAQALIGLRAERDLARARLDERVARAPRAGIVGDLRCRPDQYVAAGDILLSLTATGGQPALVAMLPGEHRPMLRPGMPLSLKLRGYTGAPQDLVVTVVSDEVVGPEEAKRLLGPEVAAAIPLNGPLVRIEARFPGGTFETDGKTYELHDGMWGSAEVRVRSESVLAALVPGLRALMERSRG